MAQSDVALASKAFEVLRSSSSSGCPVVYTCEHASNALPTDWQWSAEDQWIEGTHWASDIGAAEVTRRLVERSGAVGILAKFSRLLIDANRDLSAENLYRTQAEGKTLRLNENLKEDDRRKRLEDYYLPYHKIVDQCIRDVPGVPVIAIHSFTPVYNGSVRDMEVGVLFDHSDDLAEELAVALRAQGLVVAMNQPYSGKNGMMYSAYRHAHDHGREAIELELRQDLLGSPEACIALADRIYQALHSVGLGGE